LRYREYALHPSPDATTAQVGRENRRLIVVYVEKMKAKRMGEFLCSVLVESGAPGYEQCLAQGPASLYISWHHVERLLRCSTFPARPKTCGLDGGIFLEQKMEAFWSRKRPTEAVDKYENSGGNKGSLVWPTAGPGAPRLRRTSYRLIATSRGGEETTRPCCAYTSLTEPHDGRVLWHIPPHRDGGGGAGGGEALAARAARVPVVASVTIPLIQNGKPHADVTGWPLAFPCKVGARPGARADPGPAVTLCSGRR
jgi:hypothetical protein